MVNKILDQAPSQSNKIKINADYIIWLIQSRGSFGFTTSGLYRNKTPAFQLKMTIDNKEILEQIRDYLGLRNRIYEYRYPGKEKSKRNKQAILIVRDFRQLKDILIPFFYKKLKGRKAGEFMGWLEKIGSDPDVSDRFKSLHRLYKWGMYNNLPKFIEKFKN